MPPERTIQNKPFKAHRPGSKTHTSTATTRKGRVKEPTSNPSRSAKAAVPRRKSAPAPATSTTLISSDLENDDFLDNDDEDLLNRSTHANDADNMDLSHGGNDDDDDDDSSLPEDLLAAPMRTKSSSKSKAKSRSASGADATGGGVKVKQSIPAPLLRTLMQHHFSDKDMKVGVEASLMVGKYIDTFVREAVARAAFEREEEATSSRVGARERGGEFVDVEDLDKLAPQLLLDF